MYLIKFKSLYYDKIWGGHELEKFRSNLPEGSIGKLGILHVMKMELE